MKKFLMSLSIVAICALALDISMLNVQNQRLKNKLADVKISDPALVALIANDEKRINELELAMLNTKARQSITAVNERQGAHQVVYVESDSWVDLANGEKVPAYKQIAETRDIDAAPNSRWTATPGLNIRNTPVTHYNGVAVVERGGYWVNEATGAKLGLVTTGNINHGSFVFDPPSTAKDDAGEIIKSDTSVFHGDPGIYKEMGTGGWNR